MRGRKTRLREQQHQHQQELERGGRDFRKALTTETGQPVRSPRIAYQLDSLPMQKGEEEEREEGVI